MTYDTSLNTSLPAYHVVSDAAVSPNAPALSPIVVEVMALPQDWHQHPQTFLTEFICLGRLRSAYANIARERDIGPWGKRRHLYRTDPSSQYDALPLMWSGYEWNTAEVTYKGRREIVLWTRSCRGMNLSVSALLKKTDTVHLRGGPLPAGKNANGLAYIVRNFLHKPSFDHMTSDDAHQFGKAARPLFKNWWRAVAITGGWRVYGDCVKELTVARLSLR